MSRASDPASEGAAEAGDQGQDGWAGGALDLPDETKRRVAKYVLPALTSLPEAGVPTTLRFARRWSSGRVPPRLVQPILEALDADQGFAESVRQQLLAASGPAADGIATAEQQGDTDPAGAAALLFLVRPDGWRERLVSLLEDAPDPASGADVVQLRREIAALERRLDRGQQRWERDVAAARQAETDAKARLESEAQRLRALLADAQQSLRVSDTALAAERERAEGLDREARRLRARQTQLAHQVARHEASGRDSRVAATARAKALLDVLQGAAAGLAEELALPAAAPAPAELVPAVEPSRQEQAPRIQQPHDLGEALALPGCHLIVDGYNVTKGMWPQAPLQQQRERLVTGLAALQSRTAAEVTVVFDGAAVGPVPSASTRAVRVRFSPSGEPADRVIVHLAAAEPSGRPVIVVSSDRALVSGALAAGARTADREVLAGLLEPAR